ncbi:AfsR/SARP family transcriptional regulator [Nocardioides stalactiti]|uniref:AfsR/SARP family transcriptional regulator n=1 Tax=Nocardioides stalactiti TaxID=2755356 RepID=UPI0015FFF598|nr:BTAD domain-containing putative transcriptional regulator [Nocardioides stalactiti]
MTQELGVATPRRVDALLSLLGTFRLEIAGTVVAVPIGAQRMLALLCLRQCMSRHQLAGSLWPDSSSKQALTNLRQVCWRLRDATAGAPVVVENGTLMELGPEVLSDVGWMSQSLLLPAGEATALSRSFLFDLTRTEAAHLLVDWDEEWLEAERERFRQTRLHVLERWAVHLAEQRDHGLALEAGLAALHTDPLRETAHRTVIRLHLLEGNVAEAQRAYARCRSLLWAELGVEPSLETRALLSSPRPAAV